MHSREAEIVPKDQRRGRRGYAELARAMQRTRVTARRLARLAWVAQKARELAQSSRRLTQVDSE